MRCTLILLLATLLALSQISLPDWLLPRLPVMASLPAIRLRQLQQRHHQLQQQHRQLEIRHETLRLEHQRQIRHHQRVGQRIARRSILAIGRNLAAAPLEAVPVLGWAALAGGLALDIRDACLSLRDLGQELPPGCDLVE